MDEFWNENSCPVRSALIESLKLLSEANKIEEAETVKLILLQESEEPSAQPESLLTSEISVAVYG